MKTKTCTNCNLTKSLDDFSFRDKKNNKLRSRCRNCESKSYYSFREQYPDRLKASWNIASKRYYDSLPMERRKVRGYGITIDDYNNMIDSQNGVCLICNKPNKLVIDHNHTTGKVRGLLCHYCNLGIGYFKDNTDNLNRAIEYLNNNAE